MAIISGLHTIPIASPHLSADGISPFWHNGCNVSVSSAVTAGKKAIHLLRVGVCDMKIKRSIVSVSVRLFSACSYQFSIRSVFCILQVLIKLKLKTKWYY